MPQHAARQPTSLRNTALGLLARREHSRKELHQKLLRKCGELTGDVGNDTGDGSHAGLDKNTAIASVLDQLAEQGLLSDDRFAEAYINMRARKGYGPVRIAMELAEKGVLPALSQPHMDARDWDGLLRETWHKKFKHQPRDFADKARQLRFLQSRGFSPEAIHALFK